MLKDWIIFENDDILGINKPNDLLVHPSHYARNIKGDTLVDIIKKEGYADAVPIHRLDRKTSGVILFAKSPLIAKEYQKLFTNDQIEKNYIAVVRGHINESGKIDSPIRKDESVVYKDALTYYKRLDLVELNIPVHPYGTSRYSLVQLTPKTGRMHQLRKHMNKVSHPIVGDYKHGDRFHNRMFETEFKCDNLFLHAQTLKFKPINAEKEIEIKAPFPIVWDVVLAQFPLSEAYGYLWKNKARD